MINKSNQPNAISNAAESQIGQVWKKDALPNFLAAQFASPMYKYLSESERDTPDDFMKRLQIALSDGNTQLIIDEICGVFRWMKRKVPIELQFTDVSADSLIDFAEELLEDMQEIQEELACESKEWPDIPTFELPSGQCLAGMTPAQVVNSFSADIQSQVKAYISEHNVCLDTTEAIVNRTIFTYTFKLCDDEYHALICLEDSHILRTACTFCGAENALCMHTLAAYYLLAESIVIQ